MKKLILGSAALTLLAIAITIFQISCQKTATAQTTTYTLPPATTSTLGGVIVGNGLTVSANGTLSANSSSTQLNKIIYEKYPTSSPAYSAEIWTANYDGTGQTKINIVLPSGLGIAGDAKLSPNGQTVFFEVGNSTTFKFYIYSCNLDGSNVRQVIDGSALPNEALILQGAN